jgi:chemotaxis protein methyltransferase CheR
VPAVIAGWIEDAMNNNPTITEQEFAQLRRLLHQTAGISLSDNKQTLVLGRLAKRLRETGQPSFTHYLRDIIAGNQAELRIMVDLLTTNETSFFREPKHFELLRGVALNRSNRNAPFSVWSAACSSGEEPYTIAMVLMDALGESASWDVVATDISTRVLARAQSAHYALERANNIPQTYLKKYCLKGVREQTGTFLIAPPVRERVRFRHLNLIEPLPEGLGPFDVIFLRNVMIYFENETKRKIVEAMAPKLRKGGYFLIGHSETLSGITSVFQPERPSEYRKA